MAHSLDLGSGGSASFPFDSPGDSVTGKILNLEEVQQTDMDTGKPAVWDDGKPKLMYRVELQTGLHDGPDDDGVRSVYLRGAKKPESKSSLAAVLAAVRGVTGGRTALTVGGTLTLTYTGNGEAPRKGYNAPKHYAATYLPPSVDLGEPESAPAAPAAAPAPVAPSKFTPEQLAAMAAAGVDPAVLAAM